MYYALLHPTVSPVDDDDHWIGLNLDDDALLRLLEAQRLHPACSVALNAQRSDRNLAGVVLKACDASQSFEVRSDGRAYGVIPFDEIRGALGRRYGVGSLACEVLLIGLMNICRRGMLDLQSGAVDIFTGQSDLAFKGCTISVANPASTFAGMRSRLMIEIGPCEPSLGSLDLSSATLCDLRSRFRWRDCTFDTGPTLPEGNGGSAAAVTTETYTFEAKPAWASLAI